MAAVVSHRIVTPGLTGLSAYADWWQILGDLCSEGEQVVSFNAQRLGTSALLEDVRLAAVWYTVGEVFALLPLHDAAADLSARVGGWRVEKMIVAWFVCGRIPPKHLLPMRLPFVGAIPMPPCCQPRCS
jgi:hypothetical protein